MDRIRIGHALRAVRRRRGLRQEDLARRSGVSQQTVSRVEQGDFGKLMVDTFEAIVAAAGIQLSVVPRYRGADLARLLDERHALVVEDVVRRLRALGWEVVVEYSFNHFGERGSVDVLAWHPRFRALLVIEVKTAIVDMQDLMSSHDRKMRIVPQLVARERGWHAAVVGRVLAMPDTTVLRRAVAEHAATFDAMLPDRTREVTRWLAAPDRDLRAVWFLPRTHTVSRRRRRTAASDV